MTVKKFHISDDGAARQCSATQRSCKFGGDEQHYSTAQEAQTAYEQRQIKRTIQSPLSKKTKKNNEINLENSNNSDDLEYNFTSKIDDYGISFKAPDFDGVYSEEFDDGSVFYRFEQLDELFDDFTEDDVEEGYTFDMPLNTLQQCVSRKLVNDYAKADSQLGSFSFNDKFNEYEKAPPSIMRLMIHKGEFFVIDGNHRFAAAKVNKQEHFTGIVIMVNDDMTAMAKVPPHHFNKLVERRKAKMMKAA